MSALLAIVRLFELIVSIFLKSRNLAQSARQMARQRRLENESIAYDKLSKATRARLKNQLSRAKSSKANADPARDKPVPRQLRPDKYRRD